MRDSFARRGALALLATLAAPSLARADFQDCLASLRASAHVVLPVGTFAETSGTFVNAEGRWQSFTAAARAVGLKNF